MWRSVIRFLRMRADKGFSFSKGHGRPTVRSVVARFAMAPMLASALRNMKPQRRVILMFFAAVPVGPAGSQTVGQNLEGRITKVGDAITCPKCTIALEPRATLKPNQSEAAFRSPFIFDTDSKGNFYVVDPFGAIGVRVFSAGGSPRYAIDRKGSGPGEFTRISAIALDPHDSLHVHGNNYSVFAPSGKHVHSSAPLASVSISAAIFLNDGTQLILGYSGDRSLFGQPFHVVAADGALTKSFGMSAGETVSILNPWSQRSFVSASGGDSFLTGTSRRYSVEKWSVSRGRLSTVVRSPRWFLPWDDWDSRSDLRPPPPRLMAAMEDSSGTFWTLLLVADKDWQASAPSGQRARGLPSVADMETRFDTVIEAIDSRTGKLIQSIRLGGVFVAMFGRGLVAQTIEDDGGEVEVRVWKLTLKREKVP